MHCRIEALRVLMKNKGISATIIPTADPHMSEYIPGHYQLRKYLCGFTGSAGTLVVTADKCGLWTDGRYYIQAERELFSGIELYRASESETKTIPQFLNAELKQGNKIGINGKLFSKSYVCDLHTSLSRFAIEEDFYPEAVWKERPRLVHNAPFILDKKYSGETAKSKLARVRAKIAQMGLTHYLEASLENVMWLTNLRGSDIECTPVALSYFLLSEHSARLYAEPSVIDEKLRSYLDSCEISVHPYDSIYTDVANLSENTAVCVDFKRTNSLLVSKMGDKAQDNPSVVSQMKAIKNSTEIENIKKAYIKENTALIKSFFEIYNSENITEWQAAQLIEKHRRKADSYIQPSFETIAAYGENAAMMHYSPKEEAPVYVKKEKMLLIDTGGHYLEGTTDTTRTLIMGRLSAEEKKAYSMVLKSNIAIATAVFPQKARCGEIDALARIVMWKEGMDYRSSTGHGIGYLLPVHEGPQRLSIGCDERLAVGMTLSDEPGLYEEDKYGIRIENHLCVVENRTTQYGKFLSFDILNYCPIGTQGLDLSLLNNRETEFLNSYNEKVRSLYRDKLTKEEYEWLCEYTKAKMEP